MTELNHFPWKTLINPRYWLVWIGLGLLWCLAQLPFSVQAHIGHGIGLLLYYFSARRRHIASVNLRLCFPDLDHKAHKALLKANFKSLGMSFMEVVSGWWLSERRLRNRVNIEGLEHLENALKEGKGVILLSAHFTCLEMGGRLLSLYAPFHVMYRSNENPVMEYFMRKNRDHHFEKAIPRDNAREMLKSLKQGKAVWYASDQNFGHKYSVFADFFGIAAATNTATSRLARLSGARVIPFFPSRMDNDRGYTLKLYPPLQDFPGTDPKEDATRINLLIEEQVRQSPDQYLWVHRRFKDRPDQQAPLY